MDNGNKEAIKLFRHNWLCGLQLPLGMEKKFHGWAGHVIGKEEVPVLVLKIVASSIVCIWHVFLAYQAPTMSLTSRSIVLTKIAEIKSIIVLFKVNGKL